MRIIDWSSDVCSSDLGGRADLPCGAGDAPGQGGRVRQPRPDLRPAPPRLYAEADSGRSGPALESPGRAAAGARRMNNADLTRRKDAATPRGVGVLCNFYADHADNAELWDIEARRYIAFASGMPVLHPAPRHPLLVSPTKPPVRRPPHTAHH